ncbi:SPO22 (YIL073C) [Zygosaccharomyces parabailii]|nr:SPO22 (YIL073C) [Zygosaccharomyces parabailii]
MWYKSSWINLLLDRAPILEQIFQPDLTAQVPRRIKKITITPSSGWNEEVEMLSALTWEHDASPVIK